MFGFSFDIDGASYPYPPVMIHVADVHVSAKNVCDCSRGILLQCESKLVGLFCVVRREAELHFAMRHPNVVEVFGYSSSSPVCLIMERMNETLSDFLGLDLTIPFANKVSILEGVAEVSTIIYRYQIAEIHGVNLAAFAPGSSTDLVPRRPSYALVWKCPGMEAR